MVQHEENVEEGLKMADGLAERVSRIELRVDHIDVTLTDMKQDVREIRKEISSNIKWSIGVTVTLFGIMITILVAIMVKVFQ